MQSKKCSSRRVLAAIPCGVTHGTLLCAARSLSRRPPDRRAPHGEDFGAETRRSSVPRAATKPQAAAATQPPPETPVGRPPAQQRASQRAVFRFAHTRRPAHRPLSAPSPPLWRQQDGRRPCRTNDEHVGTLRRFAEASGRESQ